MLSRSISLLNYRIPARSLSLIKFRNSSSGPEICVPFTDRPTLAISCTEFAQFSDGCAIACCGDTSVMVTAVSKSKPSSTNFMPLTVDYRQKAAAAGRIPMNFHKREYGASEHEILTSRLIDRSLRPLFHNYYCETQLICNLLAIDGIHDPEVLCINAASAALALSDIPWNGPVGAVRVGLINDKVIINPTRRELKESTLNMVVTAASQSLVVMLEGSANNVLLQNFLKAIKTGVKECQKIVQSISQLQKLKGKGKRIIEPVNEIDETVLSGIRSLVEMRIKEVFQDFTHDKLSRDDAIKEIRLNVLERLKQDQPEINMEMANEAFNIITKQIFRNLILENNIRCDGRRLDQLRNIKCDVDIFKPLHGSAFFQRGQTQVLCTIALDSLNSVLQMDPVSALITGLKEKNFFLHYEFPPYATKEIGRVGTTVRREVGHGALAEKALRSVIPPNFPFTIRLTSEVLQSNGSSSMATVCGGSLALLDAGVPISNPVAGVAIGLVTQFDGTNTKHINNYKILTDILGIEDYMGDMDFKIAGTNRGITALQADIKIPGVPLKIIMEAIQAGYDAKSQIIEIMNSAISKHRTEKKCWPVVETIEIPTNKRSKFIGPGGANIRRMLVNSGVQVTFQEEEGNYLIFAPNQDAMFEAKEFISNIVNSGKEPVLEFGGIYTAKIVELKESGVMVTLYDSMKPALLHNSQLDQRKVSDPRALNLQVGQDIQVKYFGLDPVSGQMRLSRKVLMGPASSAAINLQKS
ncbi:polyribonucleotide nucleotidyltransferase 1, mitochondrial [Halyomorpha halys]|uniref:polyribonucleotide nucleotidyltransferase 1, mitochondrial n=1 Tax=Halyomorpha halys TaxID=286706 RepID=UPI0006D4CA7D|nr:polyribonucleotide nucleotidyltransferase 1, mitochondrial [Halyomorpha halys]